MQTKTERSPGRNFTPTRKKAPRSAQGLLVKLFKLSDPFCSSLRFLIGVCLYVSLLATSVQGGALPPSPPNVLIFLMDDMGVGDCRVYNPESKVSLPNLEKLAEQGMRFTDAHSPSAVCAPTRYSVMTGNYPWRGRLENGTWLFNMPSQVLPGQKTIGQLMKAVSYTHLTLPTKA